MMLRRIPVLGVRHPFMLGSDPGTSPPPPSRQLSFAVVVTDVKGDPFSGATVIARQAGAVFDTQKTDSDGVAIFTLATPVTERVEIRVEADGLVAERKMPIDSVNAGETLFVQLPVDRPEAILTPIEIGTLLLGGGATFAGVYYKMEALQLAGEILLGAGIFTAIYRHGC